MRVGALLALQPLWPQALKALGCGTYKHRCWSHLWRASLEYACQAKLSWKASPKSCPVSRAQDDPLDAHTEHTPHPVAAGSYACASIYTENGVSVLLLGLGCLRWGWGHLRRCFGSALGGLLRAGNHWAPNPWSGGSPRFHCCVSGLLPELV